MRWCISWRVSSSSSDVIVISGSPRKRESEERSGGGERLRGVRSCAHGDRDGTQTEGRAAPSGSAPSSAVGSALWELREHLVLDVGERVVRRGLARAAELGGD